MPIDSNNCFLGLQIETQSLCEVRSTRPTKEATVGLSFTRGFVMNEHRLRWIEVLEVKEHVEHLVHPYTT